MPGVLIRAASSGIDRPDPGRCGCRVQNRGQPQPCARANGRLHAGSRCCNPLVLLFLINILLFIVGMFLDAGPAITILGPILGPIFVDLGVHPVHFAIIMSVNLTVGLATPPMGLVLFVASSVSGEKVETISKAILPFLAVEVVVIFLITYVPAISMTIPRLTGFVN